MSIMVHHGACVHEIVPLVRPRLTVDCQQIAERETLRRTGRQAIGTIRHILSSVRILHENSLHGGHTGHTVSTFPSNADALRNGFLQHKRTHAVMDQHQRILRVVLFSKLQRVVDGVLPRISAGDNANHFVEFFLLNLAAQIGNPILQAGHHDGIHHGILLESLYRVNHNGLLAVFEELLGAVERIQPTALSAS